MQAIRKILKVPKDREIRVKIPSHVPTDQKVEVIVLIRDDLVDHQQKIVLLKETIDDKLFQEDIRSVSADFLAVDSENWE